MASIICPHCGTANRIGSNFCNKCGTSLGDEIGQKAPAKSPAGRTLPSPDPGADRPPAPPVSGIESAGRDDLTAEQPWLLESSDRDSTTGAYGREQMGGESSDVPDSDRSGRLITGVQGLLAPLSILPLEEDTDSGVVPVGSAALAAEQVRLLRRQMSEEPVVEADPTVVSIPRLPGLRIPWVYWLIGLVIGLPVLLSGIKSLGEPRVWPGVREAYSAIERLAPGATVLLFWAYDPATGGEMDLVSAPVVQHLLERQSRLVVVSQLPGGPATARRLIGRVQRQLAPDRRSAVALDTRQSDQNLYLPGGAATLPLLGQAPEAGLPEAVEDVGVEGIWAADQVPDLAIVFAAQAEDVQQWLEQVQPLNRVPTLAVTSAGVDPMVRPYLDSEQLSGLVSGFDGAYAYASFWGEPSGPTTERVMDLQILAQNWGHVALLVLILLGNLFALLRLERRE